MIWFLLIATTAVFGAYLLAPLIVGRSGPAKWRLMGFGSGICLAIIGLYSWLGRPELTAQDNQTHLKAQYYYSQGLLRQSVEAYEGLIELYPDNADLQKEFDNVLLDLSQASPEQLQIIQTVAELKQRLDKTDTGSTDDWRLLANSQMKLGDYDGAIKSFERLIELAPNNPEFEAEYLRATNFISAQRQAAQMTPEDREAMIENMVSGLAARLYEEGGSVEEWSRLVRSRKTLGQDTELAKDIEKVKAEFSNEPEIIELILGEAR